MSAFSFDLKESWLIEFENEEINDDRWSCLVCAVIESKPDDEECLKILTQFVSTGRAPIVRTISMSDIVSLFKSSPESKKKEETKIKEKPKSDDVNDFSLFSHPPPRFPEILSYLSKYAIVSDGSCKLSPRFMAYALKYLVLCLKDQNYFQRKVARAARRRAKEAEMLRMIRGGPRESVIENTEETNASWQKDKFDIFGDPLKDGPFHGPEMYVVLYDFYDPLVFPELQSLKVPFRAITKIDNFRPINGKPISGTASKKSDLINNFWKSLERTVSRGGMDDIALLKYAVPVSEKVNTMDLSAVLATGLIAILYSVYNLYRLQQTFIQQMRVHRMIESLESLDLSKCVVYNELCDVLIMEDPNAEIFVLFSMIEQVVAGVPETEYKVLDYRRKPSSFFTWEEDSSKETTVSEINYEPEEPQRDKRPSRRSPALCFYDDKISLAALSIDSNILKTSEIFDRFVINSIYSKIRSKFVRLTSAMKAQNDFVFYQMWLNSKEDKDIFRVKLFFFVIMRLIERIRAFDTDCGNVSAQFESSLSVNKSTAERKISSDESLLRNELQDSIFSEIDNLFYKRLKLEKEFTKSTSAAREVRKAEAIVVLHENGKSSFEKLELTCGRCPKPFVPEKLMDQHIQVKKLEQFLESPEITYLNDRNLLSNRAKFEAFVEKQNFYETFEPNRTVQRLQELYEEFNTVEYTYFSPTDTLFVLGHNDFDFRGVYHSLESCFIMSPLSLRDFVTYIVPENKKWLAATNKKYIRFLKEVEMKISNEEKIRNHEVRCKLINMYKGMTESERTKFLKNGPGGAGKDSRLETRKSGKEKLVEMSVPDMEELPVKSKQRQPQIKFFGIGCGGTRTQVNFINSEFHSQDGSTIGVTTRSWLHSGSVVTLTIQRFDCRLIVHRWIEGSEKRSIHFRDPTGILVTFELDSRPFPFKITQPNGLIIETGKTGLVHIKQTYLKSYRWGEHITKEKCRYCLHDGTVLIFRVDGAIDVLCPSGTKHTCHGFPSEEVEKYDTLAPTGELWVRDDCSKCKRLIKTMMLLTGVDSETEETYYKREDGTNCLLWPDGKLVVTYPDGTKITTTPTFEEGELMLETEEEDSVTSTTTSRPRISFTDDLQDSIGFTIVTCSYLIEHPNYATIYSEPSKMEIRILGKMKAEMSSSESLRIECHHSILKISSENAEFFSVCKQCEKRSVSSVFLGSETLLSKSKDYYGQMFYVYNSGQILHKSENQSNAEQESLNNYGESSSMEELYRNCEYHKTCKSQRRCLAIERDLTGLEFIDMDTLRGYHGSLSQDAYYDLGKLSADKMQIQHSFFDPIYRIGKEKYLMKYEKNDGFPSRLTRKNMKVDCMTKCQTPATQKATCELPKTTIIRFLRVLQPDPITVMKEITREIAVYRRRYLDLSNKYVNQLKKGKQGPFAKCIAKELELIASTLCPSLKLYPHTCTLTPYTEADIHSAAHNFDRNEYFLKSNPDDCRTENLPRCKLIPKPLKHSGNDENISEIPAQDCNDFEIQ